MLKHNKTVEIPDNIVTNFIIALFNVKNSSKIIQTNKEKKTIVNTYHKSYKKYMDTIDKAIKGIPFKWTGSKNIIPPELLQKFVNATVNFENAIDTYKTIEKVPKNITTAYYKALDNCMDAYEKIIKENK
jgi:hypothetical protein